MDGSVAPEKNQGVCEHDADAENRQENDRKNKAEPDIRKYFFGFNHVAGCFNLLNRHLMELFYTPSLQQVSRPDIVGWLDTLSWQLYPAFQVLF